MATADDEGREGAAIVSDLQKPESFTPTQDYPSNILSLTVSVDVVGEEKVKLPDGDVDVVGVDAEGGVEAVWGFLQPLPVRRLEGNRLEEDDLDEVESPDLVGLSEAIDSPHLALLVGVGKDAHCRLLSRDGEDKVLPALLRNVFAQLTEQTARPFLLHLQFLCNKFLFTSALFLERHSLLVLLEVLALGGLQVEPGVRERLHVGKQSLNERMELVLN